MTTIPHRSPRFTHPWRWLSIVLIAILASVSVSSSSAAAAPFFWDSIAVDIAPETDGSLLITETQRYVFTAPHTDQRYRYIPLDHIRDIQDVAVYANRESLPVETGIQNNQYWIRWRYPVTPSQAQTFVIKYRAVGAIQTKGQQAQIYWEALFPNRQATIQRGRALIHLPRAFAGQIQHTSSDGADATVQPLSPYSIEYVVNHPLEPGDFLRVRLRLPRAGFEIDAADRAAWVSSSRDRLREWALLTLGVGSLVAAGVSVFRKRCPSCNLLTLKRRRTLLKKATAQTRGQRQYQHRCDRCGYRYQFQRTVPRKGTKSRRSWGHSRSWNSGGTSYSSYGIGYTGGSCDSGGYTGSCDGGSSGGYDGGCDGGGGG